MKRADKRRLTAGMVAAATICTASVFTSASASATDHDILLFVENDNEYSVEVDRRARSWHDGGFFNGGAQEWYKGKKRLGEPDYCEGGATVAQNLGPGEHQYLCFFGAFETGSIELMNWRVTTPAGATYVLDGGVHDYINRNFWDTNYEFSSTSSIDGLPEGNPPPWWVQRRKTINPDNPDKFVTSFNITYRLVWQAPEPVAAMKVDSDDCTIIGTDGDDVLTGTDGDDVICGLGGDDVIDGGGGNDIIKGGAGDDTIDGGAGDDHLGGGAGDDTIDGGPGDDTIHGATGEDTLTGGTGKDHVDGNSGDDAMSSEPGDPVEVVTEDGHVVHDSTNVSVIEDADGDGELSQRPLETVLGMM